MKQPMKSRDALPKNVPGVGLGRVKVDIKAQYNKNFAYVILYWINFTNNHCYIDFCANDLAM